MRPDAFWSPHTQKARSAAAVAEPSSSLTEVALEGARAGGRLKLSARSFQPGGAETLAESTAKLSLGSSTFTPVAESFVPGGAADAPPPAAVATVPEYVPGDGFVPAGARLSPPPEQESVSTSRGPAAWDGNGRGMNPPMPPAPALAPLRTREVIARAQPLLVRSLFLPEDYEQYFRGRAAAELAELGPADERLKEVPRGYNCVAVLDDDPAQRAMTPSLAPFTYPTKVFKVVESRSGVTCCLRRVDKMRTTLAIVSSVKQRWAAFEGHTNVIPLLDIFLHQGAIFFSHAYFAGAQTLQRNFFDVRGGFLQEEMLWSIVCQLLAGLRAVHRAGCACRCVNATRILFTGHCRVRLACVGVEDVLKFESKRTVAELQHEDMRDFGRLILMLACRNANACEAANIRASVESARRMYSSPAGQRLIELIAHLLNEDASVYSACHIAAEFLLDELDQSYNHADALEGLLSAENGSSRSMRLLLKLNTVLDRPGVFSETGNRYVLALFRSFVFHQTGEEGRPSLEFGHVVESIAKLDVRSDEEIVLSTPDEKSLIIVTYADVARCLDIAFNEIASSAAVHSRLG